MQAILRVMVAAVLGAAAASGHKGKSPSGKQSVGGFALDVFAKNGWQNRLCFIDFSIFECAAYHFICPVF